MKTLTITAKCSDTFSAQLDEPGKPSREHDGYVPEGLGIGGGDYVEMTIDLKTGKIQNWVPPAEEAFAKFK
jgi:hypothetical protein